MPLPSFLCIGAQKAATSWLFVTLQEHPDIWMPAVKELHYFDYLYVPECRGWAHRHIRKTARSAILHQLADIRHFSPARIKHLHQLATVDVFSEDWYRRAFDRPEARGKVTGDITPSYCTLPVEGIQYVHALLGNPRLIYIIRDPLDRALSHLRMKAQRRHGKQAGSLSKAQWRKLARKTRIAHRGNYRDYIRNWLSVFERDNMLFIPFGMIRERPLDVMRQVEQHLGISSFAGYSSPNRPAHVTTKVTIPDSVIKRLSEELQPQQAFLREFFDPDFFAMI
jgi:hypothetical protein